MPNLKTVNLGNLAADGSTPGKQISGTHRNNTGSVNVRVNGTFGGGILTLEGSLDDVSYYPLGANAVLSASGGAELRLVEGEYLRATMAGAVAPNVDPVVVLPGTAQNN